MTITLANADKATPQKENKMSDPIHTITRSVSADFWPAGQYIAWIYADKIVIETSYIKWVNNSSKYTYWRNTIREQTVIDAVLADMAKGCEKEAWSRIGRNIDDYNLVNESV